MEPIKFTEVAWPLTSNFLFGAWIVLVDYLFTLVGLRGFYGKTIADGGVACGCLLLGYGFMSRSLLLE